MDFNSAIVKLNGRTSRKLDHNTYLERCTEHGFGDNPEGAVCVRLHSTHIITYRADGATVLRSGGWQTVTTKDRMNKFSPVRINQVNGFWSFEYHGKTYAFADEVTLYADGIVAGAGMSTERDQLKLRRQVRQYAKDFAAAIEAGEVSAPSGGDCFYCQGMVTDLGSGKTSTSRDHLLSHMNEEDDDSRYFVPTLLVKAVEAGGRSPVARQWVAAKLGADQAPEFKLMNRLSGVDGISRIAREQVSKAIAKYMLRALGQAA